MHAYFEVPTYSIACILPACGMIIIINNNNASLGWCVMADSYRYNTGDKISTSRKRFFIVCIYVTSLLSDSLAWNRRTRKPTDGHRRGQKEKHAPQQEVRRNYFGPMGTRFISAWCPVWLVRSGSWLRTTWYVRTWYYILRSKYIKYIVPVVHVYANIHAYRNYNYYDKY